MEIKQFRLQLVTNVGEINDKRALKLKEAFQERFPMMGKSQANIGYAFLNPELNQVLLINPDHIMYQFDALNGDPDFTTIKKDIHQIFDLLLLDDKVSGNTYIIGLTDAQGNSLDKSMKFGTQFHDWEELYGVGMRFFTHHGSDVWEYKLEPFIADPSKYFVEALCNHSDVNLESFFGESEQAYAAFFKVYDQHLSKLTSN